MVSFSMTTGAFGKDDDGNAITGLGYDFSDISYGISLEGSENVGLVIEDPGDDPYLSIGAIVSGSFDFNVGLRGEVYVDLGSVDTTLELGTDGFAQEQTGGPVTLDTSGFTVETLEVEAVGFDLSKSFISLGLGATLDANLSASGYMTYDFGIDSGGFDFTLLDNQDINVDYTYWMIPETPQITFDLVGGFDGNITKFELGDFVEISIDVPEFEFEDPEYTENAESGIDTVQLTGVSSPFASIEISLASFILPPGIGPISIDFDPLEELLGEEFADYLSLSIEGGMFDAKLVGSMAIGQDMTITSEVKAEMVTSLGETVTGSMGDDFTFVTPEGEGSFTVTANYTLEQTVEAITSLVLNATLDWRALYFQLEAVLDLGWVFSDTVEVAFAMWEDSIDLGELVGLTYSFDLYNDITTYLSDAGQEEYTIHYETFVTALSGRVMNLTTNQITAVGGSIANVITGNGLDNRLEGMAGRDTLLGMGGDDTLIGGAGGDVLDGGDGVDIVSYGDATEGVIVRLASGGLRGALGDRYVGVENVLGSLFDDRVVGDTKSNTLMGNDGNDTILGGVGRDLLAGGAGADDLFGGTGFDKVSYFSDTVGVYVDLNSNVGLFGMAQGDTFDSIEFVVGSNFNDTIIGGAANETLRGFDGDDSILGGEGDNRLFGGDGNDSLSANGNEGNDTFNGGAGNNYIVAGSGDNLITVEGDGQNLLYGQEGNDTVLGGDGGDFVGGGSGNDLLNGGAGLDGVDGGEGDDTLIASEGNDSLDGGDGIDTLDYSAGTFGVHVDLVEGEAYESNHWDMLGDDVAQIINFENVIGTGSADKVYGSNGDNVFYLGGGSDTVYGGAGDDEFHFTGKDYDSVFGGEGDDVVYMAGKGNDYYVQDYQEGGVMFQVLYLVDGTSNGTSKFTRVERAVFEEGPDFLFTYNDAYFDNL